MNWKQVLMTLMSVLAICVEWQPGKHGQVLFIITIVYSGIHFSEGLYYPTVGDDHSGGIQPP